MTEWINLFLFTPDSPNTPQRLFVKTIDIDWFTRCFKKMVETILAVLLVTVQQN